MGYFDGSKCNNDGRCRKRGGSGSPLSTCTHSAFVCFRLFRRISTTIIVSHLVALQYLLCICESATGKRMSCFTLQTLKPHQKINMFPHSFECTRKDALARNIRRLQQEHGERYFPWFPSTYVLPRDLAELQTYLSRHPVRALIVPICVHLGSAVLLLFMFFYWYWLG